MLKRHNKNSNSLRRGLYFSLEQSYSPLRKVCSARRKTYSRKISCFSIAGACCKLSGVCLLLLASLLVNPTTTSVYAFDSAPDDGGTGNTGSNTNSSAITSSINIAFTPESGSASLTPISADGASARYSIKATVGVENSGGYTVYLGSNKSELTGKNTGETINGVNSSATYEELPLNTWGYNAIEGETPGTTFSKVPTNNRGDVIASNNSTNIKEDNKTFTLSFAAHIGNDKPADTYENEITLSVISSPLEITGLTSLANMQDMTSDVCTASAVGDSIQLKDTRDGKYYWVTKLADGKCWMTQNLDLDLSTSVALTPEDSDVTANWTPGYTMATSVTSSTILADNIGQRSWSLGDYRITNPNTSNDCGVKKSSLANCAGQVTSYLTPTTANDDKDAHYIVGDYYQWNTATAGTGGTIISGQASGSICPKGWRLPTSGANGEFVTLVNKLGGTSSTNNITQAPFYGVRGGYVSQDVSNLLGGVGNYGRYWSAMPNSSNAQAYYLNFFGTIDSINSSANAGRYYGFSVRCIAR